MKKFIRRVVAFLVRVTHCYACDTYGDAAELHPVGPCGRCVGRAVNGMPQGTQQEAAS